MGTTFTDTATRDIFDTTLTGTNGNTAPYIGDFRPENGETLDEFLAAQIKTASQRHLDSSRPSTPTRAPTSPLHPNYLVNWSLSFGHGLKADTPGHGSGPLLLDD